MRVVLGEYDGLAISFQKLKQDMAFFEGMVLTGINIRYRDDDVLLVVKATLDGKPLVCFTAAVTDIDAFDLFSNHIHSRSYPHVSWKPDKYAKS